MAVNSVLQTVSEKGQHQYQCNSYVVAVDVYVVNAAVSVEVEVARVKVIVFGVVMVEVLVVMTVMVET
jgi:hypothetical protein